MRRDRAQNTGYIARVIALIICTFFWGLSGAKATNGAWHYTSAEDGAKIGLVFPDYDPNQFVLFWLRCAPGKDKIDMIAQFDKEPTRVRFPLQVVLDGRRKTYTARKVANEMGGISEARVQTSRHDPFLARAGKANGMSLMINGESVSLAFPGRKQAFQKFWAACK